MANYIVQDTSLAAVADAIRAKTGGGEALAFPAGFVEAVEGIKAGGSSSGGEGLTAVTMAVGIIVDIPMGLANSSLNVTNFTSTTGASGTVGEE